MRWVSSSRREAAALQEEAALYDALAACHLRYLAMERKLRTSTISRKGRVFRYFLTYLAQSIITRSRRQTRLRKSLSSSSYSRKVWRQAAGKAGPRTIWTI